MPCHTQTLCADTPQCQPAEHDTTRMKHCRQTATSQQLGALCTVLPSFGSSSGNVRQLGTYIQSNTTCTWTASGCLIQSREMAQECHILSSWALLVHAERPHLHLDGWCLLRWCVKVSHPEGSILLGVCHHALASHGHTQQVPAGPKGTMPLQHKEAVQCRLRLHSAPQEDLFQAMNSTAL